MNTNPFQSAFGSQGSSGSAFTATTNHVNTNSSNPSGVSGNSAFRITSAFGSNQNGGGFSDGGRYSANENRQNNSSYNQAATFDRSGNLMANTHSTRGSGGGRGSNSYRGSGFGGNSGRGASTSHRGSANKTYVAPGLSTGHQQLQQHGLSAGSGNTNATGSSFTSPSAGAKTGRGRGGYQSRGGRGGARGRGVTGGMPGQYRSLQWRADQNTSQEADSTMSVDSSMGVTTAGGFKSGPNASSQVRGQQQQHSSSMSAFGAQRQNENSDFNQTGPAFPGGQSSQGQWFSQVGTTGYQPNGSFQNTFVGGTSTVPHRSAFIAAPSDTSNQRSSSAFGLGGPGGNSNSGNQDSVFAIPASQGPVFAAQQKSLPSNSFTKGPASSKQEPGSTEDADESRLARFTAVPIGNRFEEVRKYALSFIFFIFIFCLLLSDFCFLMLSGYLGDYSMIVLSFFFFSFIDSFLKCPILAWLNRMRCYRPIPFHSWSIVDWDASHVRDDIQRPPFHFVCFWTRHSEHIT
ncbi:hypothetical protein BC939DRAFT_210561 [Gamsiella multidivaricata]|uniref:uncharacterized protein n=1 Tax=Gamsiella multidivaricata TaxID=101098 RepID=UPI00221FA86A|nr:uncharacterized protein BC939DRAFT_210561 [Gamsiella multidivaricata]KAI7821236.1 hypothetical protein BC939DRAFT_210561 [Gamsiella multidivaricata]